MNFFLHGIEPRIVLGDTIYEPARPEAGFDVILTNPPFGTKGANQMPDRDDFTIETSNKQLNFVQHILTVLKPGGRAAVVLPDNCLFADQAGEVFEIVTQDCALHTVLRLLRGNPSFALQPGRQGQRRLFLQQGASRPRRVWSLRRPHQRAGHHQEGPAADARALRGVREVLRHRPQRPGSKAASARPEKDSKEDRLAQLFRRSARCGSRDFKLDSFKWLKDDSLEDADELPPPDELATDAIAELEGAVEELNAVLALLENGSK